MIVDTNNGYVVAMEGCEKADPHARFQYYADAEPFVMRKSKQHPDVVWVLVHLIDGRPLGGPERFRNNRRVKENAIY